MSTQIILHKCSQYSLFKKQKQSPDVHHQVKGFLKSSYSYTMKYHSAIKRNELLIHATTWIKLKIIIISERIKQNSTYWIILLTQKPRKCKLIFSDRSSLGMEIGERSIGG